MNLFMCLLTVILLCLLLELRVRGQNGSCIETQQCVTLNRCLTNTSIVYPCNNEETYICCSQEDVLEENVSPRTSAFPKACGVFSSGDRIINGENASIGQFPWMVLLGYRQQGLDFVQFLCGGSLISEQYILTAAHCIAIDARLKLDVVRLGELNLETEKDCEAISNVTVCADPPKDIAVDAVIPHENYNSKTYENDIALVRLKRKVNFTEYIQPICLPFEKDFDNKTNTINTKLTVSGWGKTETNSVGGSSVLQFANVLLWNRTKCNVSIPPRARPVRESQLCANGLSKEDACRGDSGGPLFDNSLINKDLRNYQVGIVSFSPAQTCGNIELPTIYTNVAYFMKWIVANVVEKTNIKSV